MSMPLNDDEMFHKGISEDDLDESLEMLKTRVGQINAVFACFGSAAQHAQHFEAALAEFLSEYNKISKHAISPQDFELLDQRLQKQTLGALLREFSSYVTINDPKVTWFLEIALEKRNFLMHHFFRDREDQLCSETDRMNLLSELVGIGSILEQSSAIIRGMRVAVSRTLSRSKTDGSHDQQSDSDDAEVLFTAEIKMPDDSSSDP